ncbi:phage tail protein [Pseudomonas sp. ICMP 561]|uniref:phage tail protein n=1 Tax=Pseudomonas sp. ICMP 561 TaxID=1718918 RepID=UPI000C07B444|nr:phage tail protein [Pseudomonas sp. ICMP 561]PHN28986.1 phage tail protein [Pseudomonas sp. ICMP 561]
MSNIDWTQMITKEMKEKIAAALRLAEAKADLASRNGAAAAQIVRIQDRVETLGYGIESGEATGEDEAELAALTISLKAWKAYKFALGKVAVQPTWPLAPVWPAAPAIPDIAADPSAIAPEAV